MKKKTYLSPAIEVFITDAVVLYSGSGSTGIDGSAGGSGNSGSVVNPAKESLFGLDIPESDLNDLSGTEVTNQ